MIGPRLIIVGPTIIGATISGPNIVGAAIVDPVPTEKNMSQHNNYFFMKDLFAIKLFIKCRCLVGWMVGCLDGWLGGWLVGLLVR